MQVQLTNAGSGALQLSVFGYHLPGLPPNRHDLALVETQEVDGGHRIGAYDVAVHGPNGFLRDLRGDAVATSAGVEATLNISGFRSKAPELQLVLRNAGSATRSIYRRTGSAHPPPTGSAPGCTRSCPSIH